MERLAAAGTTRKKGREDLILREVVRLNKCSVCGKVHSSLWLGRTSMGSMDGTGEKRGCCAVLSLSTREFN